MAKYYVECPDCGTTYRVNLIGPQKDRVYKLDNWDWTCDECIQKARDEANTKAAAANTEAGLPTLIGTEKQVAWAETIRKQKISALEDDLKHYSTPASFLRIHSDNFNQDRYKAACENFKHKTIASWWIDNRDMRCAILLRQEYDISEKPLPLEEQEIAKAAEVEAKAEATIHPKETITETVTEIRIGDNFIEAIFPEKNEDFRQLVRFKLGYSWTGSYWRRDLGIKTGDVKDRAVELGHKLLATGFPIRIFDEKIRFRAIAGEYEPECKRWVMKATSGKYEGWFLISWPRDEDIYKAAKALPGSRYHKPAVVVPAEQFEQLLDFAEMYEFSISPGALELIETARKIKEQALTAQVEEKKETKQPLPGDKPEELEVPEDVNIDDEFSETEIQPNTQAAAIVSMGFDPVALGGKVVDGQVFKPDANPNSRGACARCGRPGVWICGAGETLCASHQDDY